MLNHLARRLPTVASLAFIASCSEPTGPFPAVQLRTEVAPHIISLGESAAMLAILHNPTSQRVEVNTACGPPVLFEVHTPTAEGPVYPIPLDAAWLCDGADYHVLEPGETDTVSTSWRPVAAGSFAVRSGFRAGGHLERLTRPATLSVR